MAVIQSTTIGMSPQTAELFEKYVVPNYKRFPVALGQIMMKNLTVRGSIGSPGVWPAAIRFLERTKLDLSPIQTHHFPLEQAVEAFELGQDATKCIKVTLNTGLD